MQARDNRGYVQDMVAGSALILVGIMLMVDRLGSFIIRYTPRLQEVQQWWPLLLIGVGIILLLSERVRPRSSPGGERTICE